MSTSKVMPSYNDMEPLLTPNPQRFVLFPVQYDDIWAMYRKSLASFWTTAEIDMSVDISQWTHRLNDDERRFISHVLAFFAASDGVVIENLVARFTTEVQIAEARAFYTCQAMIETIHSETYSMFIDILIKDTSEKTMLFTAMEHIPCVRDKAHWSTKWIADQETPFSLRLVAFAVVEGIFFSGSFAAIFWLRKRGLMPGLAFANELISRDEGLHTDFACLLFSHIQHRPAEEVVKEIVEEAVNIEKRFISDSLPVTLIGLRSEDMCTYIEVIADRLLLALGYSKTYGSRNPLDFMDMISMEGKTNFFERRVSEYKTFNSGSSKVDENGISFVEEF